MGFRCAICKHDSRGNIERDIAIGDSDPAIARRYKLGTASAVTIHRAKHMNITPARMEPAQLALYQKALLQIQFAAKTDRIAKLSNMIADLEALQQARKTDALRRKLELERLTEEGLEVPKGLALIPGEETGLLSHEGYFDVMPFRELRSCLEQIAKELGEWDITGSGSRADEAAGATNTTVYQVVRGDVQQVIAAGESGQAKPQTIRQLEEATSFTRLPLLTQQSKQSVVELSGGDEAGGVAPAGGVDEE